VTTCVTSSPSTYKGQRAGCSDRVLGVKLSLTPWEGTWHIWSRSLLECGE
jgi:hypothetical protein